jgi:voltage-gated potassium channel
VLERVNIKSAGMAILLTDTLTPRSDQDRDARTVLAALTIERLKPDVFCCAELTSWEHADLLRHAGVEEIVVRDWYAGVIIGSMGRNLGLAAVLKDILSTSEGNAFHKVKVKKSHVGRSIGQLHTELKAKRDLILVALERSTGRTDRKIIVNPPSDEIVVSGDVLVVIGPL